MDNKKKSATLDEIDAGKYLIGKSHDNEPKPISGKIQNKTADKKLVRDSSNEEDKSNAPEKRIEIDDNPAETERKMPRMKH
jgi:hypothetical protein